MKFAVEVKEVKEGTQLYNVDAGCVVKCNGYNALIRLNGFMFQSVGFAAELIISYVDRVEEGWKPTADAYKRKFEIYRNEDCWDFSNVIRSVRKDLKKDLYRTFGEELVGALMDLTKQLKAKSNEITEVSQSGLYVKVDNEWQPVDKVSTISLNEFMTKDVVKPIDIDHITIEIERR